MRFLILILLAASCSDYVTSSHMRTAESFCEQHGGVRYVVEAYPSTIKVRCNNDALVSGPHAE